MKQILTIRRETSLTTRGQLRRTVGIDVGLGLEAFSFVWTEVDRACRIAFREGFAKTGQRIITVAGVPFGTPGATNMLRITYVGADAAAG